MATKRLLFSCIVLIALAGAGSPLWGQTGGFAYVANCGGFCFGVGPGSVSAYTIDGTTGALTPIVDSPFPAGAGSYSVTVDPTGRFVYVANDGSANVSAYTIEGSSGELTEIADSPFHAESFPESVAVDPTGQFAYVANEFRSNVTGYTIDASTGALTEIAGSPFSTGPGSSPYSVTVHPTGQFAYTANRGGTDDVTGFTIDGTTGALTPMASRFPAGSRLQSVTTTAGPAPPPAIAAKK